MTLKALTTLPLGSKQKDYFNYAAVCLHFIFEFLIKSASIWRANAYTPIQPWWKQSRNEKSLGCQLWAMIMAVPSGPVKKMKSTSLWRRVGKNSKIGNPPLQGIEEKYLPVWRFYGAIRGFWDPWNDPLMRRFAIENNLMYAAFQSVKWTNQYNTNNAGGSN